MFIRGLLQKSADDSQFVYECSDQVRTKSGAKNKAAYLHRLNWEV
jgi:hypothetical protein